MISSTLKDRAIAGQSSYWAAVVLLAMAGTGCYRSQPRQFGRIEATAEPVVVEDEAMDQRQWSKSVAHYPTGTTEAFATRWPFPGYETHSDNVPVNAVIEPVIYGAELITLPARMVTDPPGKMAYYHGPVVPPTYNGMPPLPPEPAPPAVRRPFRPITHFRTWLHTKIQNFKARHSASQSQSQVEASAPQATEPASPSLSTTAAITQPVTTPAGQ